jgi:hypothetical protein
MNDQAEENTQYSIPDWPPQRSAVDLPDGERGTGSTGQLFEVKNGRWERVKSTHPKSISNLRGS